MTQHYDDNGVVQLAVKEGSAQAIASPPVVCELCHVGLSDWNALEYHCQQYHVSFAEYRKKKKVQHGREDGACTLDGMGQAGAVDGFFHSSGVTLSRVLSMITRTRPLQSTCRDAKETCAVCAVKDWIENRAEVYGDTPSCIEKR